MTAPWHLLLGESFRNAGERRQVAIVDHFAATYLQGLSLQQAREACVGIAAAAAAMREKLAASEERS